MVLLEGAVVLLYPNEWLNLVETEPLQYSSVLTNDLRSFIRCLVMQEKGVESIEVRRGALI